MRLRDLLPRWHCSRRHRAAMAEVEQVRQVAAVEQAAATWTAAELREHARENHISAKVHRAVRGGSS